MSLADEGRGPDATTDLGRRTLEAYPEFEVVLVDGERWQCRLVEWGSRELLVETGSGKYLLPHHSIKYIVLEEKGVEHLIAVAAAEVRTLREFLDEEGEPRGR